MDAFFIFLAQYFDKKPIICSREKLSLKLTKIEENL